MKFQGQLFFAFTFVCLGLGALAASPALAEDLVEIYQRALDNDPDIQAARHSLAASRESIDESVGKMYPQVDLEIAYSETEQEITDSDNPFQPEGEDDFPTENYALTLTQPIYDRALFAAYRQAQADVARAEAEFVSKEQDLALRIAEAYLEVLAATNEVDLAVAEKLALEKQLELVQNMMASGMTRRTELYEARARFATVEADEIGARNQLDDKFQALRQMVGELSGDLARLSPALVLSAPDPATPETWMSEAVQQNPRVLQQRKQVELMRYEVRLQNSGHFPTLDLTARLSQRDADGGLFGGGNEVETTDLLLRLNVPIYRGGSTSARARRSHQLYLKAQQELTAIQRAVQRSARTAYFGIISAISKIEALETSVSAQELALESKQEGARAGLYTSLDVLDAERDLFEARRDRARARYDYLLNDLRLKHAVGTISEGDLVDINDWLQAAG